MAQAPVRICDVGGWTDTWFAPSPGRVCSIAAGPGVEVAATLVALSSDEAPVRLQAPDVGADVAFGPDPDPALSWRRPTTNEHPLLVHAVGAALELITIPGGLGIELDVSSAVAPGASLGTSSAVVVAIVAAVEELLLGRPSEVAARSEPDLARRVFGIEVERAGRQAGVQDAWPAALGGAMQLVIDRFPEVRWRHLQLGTDVWRRLRRHLVTVAVGAHDSTAVHGEVIASIAGGSGEAARAALRRLAALADDAASALLAGDLGRWSDVLRASTEAQAALHPDLIGVAHRQAIEVAEALGCTGWKVNGAGGRGGSVSFLAPAGRADDVRAALAAADTSWQVLDLVVPFPGVTIDDETSTDGPT